MSSSVFVETSRSGSESLLNDNAAAKADSNLVVVYGKNGINVDRKGLENLIDEKTLTSISVIRITSPTPSMQEEEAEEKRKEDEKNAEEDEKGHCSGDEDDDQENSDSGDEIVTPKMLKAPAKERPEILGLSVEKFYPPEAAKELAKEILKYAGVTPLKCNVDYEFQRYIIKNDHCYTPFTSPSQLNKTKTSSESEDKPQAPSVRKLPGTAATVKQYLNKRKQLIDEKQRKLLEKEKLLLSTADLDEFIPDEEKLDEEQEEEVDEDLEDDESDYTEESEQSAESENDRDSDLDFDVNNRHGRKRKTGARRRKKAEKQRARSVMMQKSTSNKRRQHSQDNSMHEDEKAVLTPVKVNRQPADARKSISGFNVSKAIARKQIPEGIDAVKASSPLPPPTPVHTPQPKPLINIQSVQVIQPPPAVTPITAKPKLVEVAPKIMQPKPPIPSSPQTVKQIVINKVIASPKGGFTDLSTLLTRSDNLQSNVRVTELKTEKPAHVSSVKGFMPLGIETAAKNQLPAQISIQTHQSSSEIAAENDKQLDLIDSIVKDELEKSFKSSEKPPMEENSIPDLVKMLESTEKAVLEKNKLTSSFTSSSVEPIDIANAPLLETPDDEIPEDLLQHVVELMEDKSLQEAVEKEVLHQQQKQQQQQQQQQQLQQKQQQMKSVDLSQQQLQQQLQHHHIGLLQPLRHAAMVPIPILKQPKSIIEASISNTTTPSSSRDTTPTPTSGKAHSVAYVRKEPIQIIRGNGRVITLPPIEAPTTRAKRRAQTQPMTDTSFNDSESGDVSMHSDTSLFAELSAMEKPEPAVLVPTKERATIAKATAAGRKKKVGKTAKQTLKTQKADEETESQDDEDEDDPNKLWCICRQPHNNRFMICCDVCEDWFHGTCVSITKAMGIEMEQKGIEWTCPKCVKKLEAKKQRKITDLFDKKTLVQPMPKLDTPAKPAFSLVQSTITLSSLPGEKKQVIDLKKLQPGQFYSLTKVETPKKAQARGTEAIATTASVIQSAVATPTTPTMNVIAATLPSTPSTPITPLQTSAPSEVVQKKLTDFSVKKVQDSTTATVGNVTKRVIVLSSATKATGRMQKTTAAQQQQLKLSKVPTAAEKKQFALAKQQHSKTIAQSVPPGDLEPHAVHSTVQQQKHPAQKQESAELLTCIVCKKPARANSIYCSDDCIRKHAQNALINASKNAVKSPEPIASPMALKPGTDEKKKKSKGLFEDLLSMADRKPKVERVFVFERRTGRILTGSNAPTTVNLKKWLQDNPTFEVVQPGSAQALEIEKTKQKQRLGLQSPTVNNTFLPVKADSPAITFSSSTLTSPPPVLPKTIKILDLNKSKTISSATVHSQQRSSTPKQLSKYPQQVSIKPDKPEKEKDKSTTSSTSSSSSSSHKQLKKQVTTEKETAAATPSRNEASEPVRVNVRRTLKEQLLIRMTELHDDKKLSPEQVEEFVKATELEMYRLFNKDIGTKYKAKYRSLMFNIKDRKNETLFQKICAKLIEPQQLVRMSPEEMASQELAQWRENEAKHQLEMIKKSELDMLSCTKNFVLKTHKGEEVIESKSTDRVELDITIPVEDVVTVLNNATVSSTTEIEPPSAVTPRKDHSFELDSSVTLDTTTLAAAATSTSDKKKASSKERDRDREKRHKSKDRHRDKSRKRSRSRSRERHHKSSSRKDDRRDKDERFARKEELDHQPKPVKLVPPLKISVPATTTSAPKLITPTKVHKDREVSAKKSTKTPMEKFSLIDQILESTKTVEEAANLLNEKEVDSVASVASVATPALTNNAVNPASITPITKPQSPTPIDSDQEPSSTVSISTPPEDPYYKYSSDMDASIWTGPINMIDVASFQVSVQGVTGSTYLLSSDLPDELDVVGRISPDTVWDYIAKIKRSPNKEIVIIRLVPSAESENIAYTILYKYLDKRKRLGVIKTTSPNIKDFYIMPLGVGQQMPSVLYPSENFEFYDDIMRPDMLLGIVIRIMGKRHSNSASRVHRKKEATVISNRSVTSVLDGDENTSFTPPGSPKARTDTNRTGSNSNRAIRLPQKSTEEDDIDIDAIIKAPIATKNAAKAAAAAAATVAAKKDDANEPYSPGGSSDDDVQEVSLPGVREDNDLKRKMDEINRQIEAQKMEIAGLLHNEQTSFSSGSQALAPSLANISIPSNLQQILASIHSKPEPPALPSPSPKVPSMVPPPPIIGSYSRHNEEEEYTPEPVMRSNSTRVSNSHMDSKPSRLAQLSEAELLSMVPDNIDIENTNIITHKSTTSDQPPEKRPRWSEPPPPGLESEYN